jgi:ATP-dependent Lon protease
LALACAVLSANGKKAWERLEKTVLLGELALDGRVRPIKGVLPAVLAAKREDRPAVVVPVDNLAEASVLSVRIVVMVMRRSSCRSRGQVVQTYFGPQRSELAFGYAGEHSAWPLLIAKYVERLLGSGDEPGGGAA